MRFFWLVCWFLTVKRTTSEHDKIPHSCKLQMVCFSKRWGDRGQGYSDQAWQLISFNLLVHASVIPLTSLQLFSNSKLSVRLKYYKLSHIWRSRLLRYTGKLNSPSNINTAEIMGKCVTALPRVVIFTGVLFSLDLLSRWDNGSSQIHMNVFSPFPLYCLSEVGFLAQVQPQTSGPSFPYPKEYILTSRVLKGNVVITTEYR